MRMPIADGKALSKFESHTAQEASTVVSNATAVIQIPHSAILGTAEISLWVTPPFHFPSVQGSDGRLPFSKTEPDTGPNPD